MNYFKYKQTQHRDVFTFTEGSVVHFPQMYVYMTTSKVRSCVQLDLNFVIKHFVLSPEGFSFFKQNSSPVEHKI